MKSNLELALVACSYRPVISNEGKTIYMKVYGFTWITVDLKEEVFISFIQGAKGQMLCWNRKSFDEVFYNKEDTVDQRAACIQYYEMLDGPTEHSTYGNIEHFTLFDDYFKQFQFL